MPFDLDEALAATVRADASDLHLKVGARPRARVHGELRDLPGFDPLTPQDAATVTATVVRSDQKRDDLAQRGGADASHETVDGRFRVAAFMLRGHTSFVFRVVPHAPDPASLGIPGVVLDWAAEPRGLVVVTGPSWPGSPFQARFLRCRRTAPLRRPPALGSASMPRQR